MTSRDLKLQRKTKIDRQLLEKENRRPISAAKNHIGRNKSFITGGRIESSNDKSLNISNSLNRTAVTGYNQDKSFEMAKRDELK